MRFQNKEAAEALKVCWEAAQVFNVAAKAGKDDELVFADPIEDVEEVAEDDIDTNKPAEEDAE